MKSNKGRPRDPERVPHMLLQAARNIERFLQGKTFADLASDLLLQFGVERQFEIPGEVASHVSADTQHLWSGTDWQGTKDFRNLIAPEYFRVDLSEIWQVAQRTVSGLRLALEDLFAEVNRDFAPTAAPRV